MRRVGICASILAAGVLCAQPPAGDSMRGKAIFEGKGACFDCHRVKDNGSRFGPDLTEIGSRAGASAMRARGRGPVEPASPARAQAELERSLLDPDADILPQNRTVRIVTPDGAAITGRLLNQDTFTVQVIDSKERLLSLTRSSLREFSFVKNSPMPSYRGKLDPQELADVVAYLASLKGVNSR